MGGGVATGVGARKQLSARLSSSMRKRHRFERSQNDIIYVCVSYLHIVIVCRSPLHIPYARCLWASGVNQWPRARTPTVPICELPTRLFRIGLRMDGARCAICISRGC